MAAHPDNSPVQNHDSSENEDEWDDDFPLSTLQAMQNLVDKSFNQDLGSESSEDDEESGEKEDDHVTPGGRKWVPIESGVAKTPSIPEFDDMSSGCQLDQDERINLVKIVDYFRYFFSAYFLQNIANATNKYANDQRQANPEKHKTKWSDVHIPELMKFFTLTLLMGIVKKARLKDYWCRLETICTPFFTSLMRRDRFLAILRYVYYIYSARCSHYSVNI